jgi:two-component system, OmpR family, phosphate regulon sensor histidine kinase PhoR
MSHRTLRLIIILAIISIVGIVITQLYWVRRAFDLKERQFDQTVQVVLQNVAEKIANYNKTPLPSANVVTQVSSNYYVVHINDVIDANLLEHYLRIDFEKHQIKADCEYGIYDCTTEKMVYGNYMSFASQVDLGKPKTELPKWDKFTYYFGVISPIGLLTLLLKWKFGFFLL